MPTQPLPVYDDVAAAIFDCDGTLADTMPLHYAAWVQALTERDAEMSEATFYALAGAPTLRIVEILNERHGYSLDPPVVAADKEARYELLLPQARPLSAVVAAVRAYEGRALLAVASGGLRRLVERTVEALGLTAVFEVITTAEDVERGKPAPDLFKYTAEKLGVPVEDCVVYEDADLGLEAARRAGMRSVDVRPWIP